MKKQGFTLIELLLVIAVIGILSGLLFTGVFSVTGQANKKRVVNNARLLEAAIQEYRHDNNRWPFPDTERPSASQVDRTISGTGTTYKDVSWKVSYGNFSHVTGRLEGKNNDVVVEMLLNGTAGKGGPKKTYLDLRTFTTTPKGTETEFPVEETVPAYEVWRNGDLGNYDAKARTDGKNIPLVYRGKFVKCPACGTLNFQGGGLTHCRKGQYCPDATQDDSGQWWGHEFTKSELKKLVDGAMPYVITFDLVNKSVSVSHLGEE